MTELNNQNLSTENQRSLKTLGRTLTMSQGNFSLIFIRCNYSSLREKVRNLLEQQLAIKVKDIFLPTSTKSLYDSLVNAIQEDSPQALIVFGLEAVVSLNDVLTAANRSRDRFRRDFPFPVVIWVTDGVLSKLGRLANDLNTWAGPPIHFEVSPEDLREFLLQKAEQAFNGETNFKLAGCEIEAIEKDLPLLGEHLDPELQACWEIIRGTIEFQNKHIDAALKHYQKSLTVWQQNGQLECQGIVCMKIGMAYNLKAELHRAENESYWQQARAVFYQALDCFKQANQENRIAECISQLGEILQELKAWEELQALAETGLKVHLKMGFLNLLAQDYAFLAQAAVHKGEWQQVHDLVTFGLAVLEKAAAPTDEKILHLLLLGKSQWNLGQKAEAFRTLEQAKQIRPQKNSLHIYIQILEELQTLYKESHEYLKAFELKLEQQELETKYRLRAFIGAARLQPPAPETLNLDLDNREQIAGAVEEIVAASGRQQDVNRLIERIGRPDCKLTVLHGQSGVGKSSIVQAALVPALKLTSFDGWDAMPVLVQVYANWVQEFGYKLAQGLLEAKAVVVTPQLDTPAAIIQRLRENENCRLVTVLIFDQFEEFFFVYKDPEVRQEFYLFLSQVIDIPYIKIILSLREDYLHYLLEANRSATLEIIDRDILNKNILYYLGNFSRSDAKTIIVSLTERAQFYLQPELIDALIEELASELGEVRPIELQVVGSQLQAEKITTLAQYQKSGPKKAIVERFLQAAVLDCGPENQDVAKLILYLLTDENNTRPQKTSDVLELEVKVKASTLDLVLEILVKSGLVLRLPSTPADRYQLVHDYLVSFIRNSQFNPFIAELEKEREQRKLTQEKLIEVQKQQLKAARRATATLVGLLVIVGTVATIATLVGINTYLASLSLSSKNNAGLERLISAIKLGKELKKLPIGVIKETKVLALSELNQAVANEQELNRLEGHNGAITKVVFSHDGKMIATASKDKTAIIWGIDGREISKLEGHRGTITSIAFSKDGKTVVTGSKDKRVRIWILKGEKFVFFKELKLHKASITSVDISPDGQTIASASEHREVKLWTRTGKLIKPLTHPEIVAVVRFSPDSKMIAAAGKNEIVKLWNIKGEEIDSKINNYGTLNMDFKDDGQSLIFGNKDGTYKLYQLNGNLFKSAGSLCGIRRNVSSIASPPNNRHFFSIERMPGNAGGKEVNFNAIIDGQCGEYRENKIAHSDSITDISLSPDSKILATASKDQTVKLWDLTKQKISYYYEEELSLYKKALFSPNGQLIATSKGDNTVSLWHRDGTFIRTIEGNSSVLSFSPDHQSIITASPDDIIKLGTYEGKEITWKDKIGSITSIKLSPNGQFIATVGIDNTVKLWKRNGTLIKNLTQYGLNKTPIVTFSPDSQKIVTFGEGKTLKLWNKKGEFIKSLFGHSQSVEKVVFSPDSQLIATIGDDNILKLWNSDGTLIKMLEGHPDPIKYANFSKDSEILVSISAAFGNSQIRLWRSNGTLLLSNPIDEYGLFQVYVSPGGNFIASTHYGGAIKLWDYKGNFINSLTGHKDTVKNLSFSANGQTIVSGSDDGTVRLWKRDLKTGQFEKNSYRTLREHTAGVTSVSISPDGQIIASASSDKNVLLWDKEGKLINDKLGRLLDNIEKVSFSPDGKFIIAFGRSYRKHHRNTYSIKIWTRDGKEIKTIKGHHNGTNSFDISSDTNTITYVSKDDSLKLWNISDGMLLATLKGHEDWINSVSFSPNGQNIASASDDKKIRLWDSKGEVIKILEEHKDKVNRVSFNPKSSKQLASASSDKSVRVWNDAGQEVKPISPHKVNDSVDQVIFSPDGGRIYFASAGNINFWDIKQSKSVKTPLTYESNNNYNSLNFSPDGSVLALAGSPISLYFPNAFWSKDIAHFTPNSESSNVSFSPDGKAIADIKNDKGYAWNFLDLDEALQRACSIARDYLANNSKVEKRDKNLCDDVRVLQPEHQANKKLKNS
ncbi:hypothetical protein NG798_24450 [Ancylothrix sp. C2]|uniref:nSTAND1 domain-containing NTPase n=1 Tax=Ancylothrix sp. D3o TaxID=2953691 RepID=UPI0021BA4DA5|nr:hypothetical protein [Ancylothrix sp. D3o]MCT7952953.1 hypothetical protein [Ancylothrix sp. D3o]